MLRLVWRTALKPVNAVWGFVLHHYKELRRGALYLSYRITGRSYADYFAQLMDRSIRETPEWSRDLDFHFQIDYLVKHGLRPHHRLLDFGCGPLAAGVLMIDYLDPGNYTGVDISAGLIEAAKKRVERDGLAEKRPTILHFQHGALPDLSGGFDFIWAQSVLTHMPEHEIEELFRAIRRYMTPKTVFFATFAKSDRTKHVGFMHWYYEAVTIRAIAYRNKLACEVMKDWKHPQDFAGVDGMVKITL